MSEPEDDIVFKALANSYRRQILTLLQEKELTTGDICEQFKILLDRRTVSLHINILRKANLIIARREGRRQWNCFNGEPLKSIFNSEPIKRVYEWMLY